MVDTVQTLQAGDSLLLLLQGPLPEGDASSALPTQDELRLNKEEFWKQDPLSRVAPFDCNSKLKAPCTKHLDPLFL